MPATFSTPQQRLHEIARLLARGVLALHNRGILPPDSPAKNPPESGQTALATGATQG